MGPLRLNIEGPSFQVMTRHWPCWDWLKTEDAQTSATPITSPSPGKAPGRGKQISLINTGATFSVFPSFSGPLFPSAISVMGIDGKSTCPLATGLLPCLLDNSPITHSFLVMPSCPVPLLGWDILTKLGATLQLTQSPSASLLLPLLAPSLHGNTDPPPPVSLVNPKFPISLTHRQGLKPLITWLLGHRFLIPIDSPCNTPILPVRKADRTYRLVQDLRLINEAVVPIHPVVPNPYTLLSRIPSGTTHFSVLDLKDAFFTIPLDPDSYHLYLGGPRRPGIPPTHLDSSAPGIQRQPSSVWQALARDLQQCSLEPSTLLQYVDDLLLCSPSLDTSRRQTAGLRNFLGDKGYRVSPPRLNCQPPPSLTWESV
ncbi:LOW QUALITY PROTEIN: hypothetical protein QTO34_016887 [Cnephaeus nilssonii]|uniref:Uncharacterized protein n=1 Tax=Cnephaeus nilssonii TaxID=3371016 RepID=A0AA40I369_CNENI|nr:LOW QUALITY PROTEIN: hypothetical protein QTO34_016887 [Eptesicus nilssonii]